MKKYRHNFKLPLGLWTENDGTWGAMFMFCRGTSRSLLSFSVECQTSQPNSQLNHPLCKVQIFQQRTRQTSTFLLQRFCKVLPNLQIVLIHHLKASTCLWIHPANQCLLGSDLLSQALNFLLKPSQAQSPIHSITLVGFHDGGVTSRECPNIPLKHWNVLPDSWPKTDNYSKSQHMHH